MPDEPPTPLERSRAETGRVTFKMRPSNYTAFATQLNNSRGFPKGRGTRAVTERALPPVESMPVATDGSGHVLVNLAREFVRGEPPIINNPHVTELTAEEYAAVRPEETRNP